MQYEIYEAKVKKVSAFLVKLYSHIALIITILALLTAAATAAVAAKGSIVAESEFNAEIEYGSKLEFDAEAIFGDANYEYRVKGTEEWTDEAPIYPGDYEIRAYAMTSFGTRRYGDVHTFTIKPRELTLKVSTDPVQYGDMPTVSGNLVSGDTVSFCSVIFDKLENGAYTAKARADKDTLVILDEDGNDVTSCYTVVDTPDSDVTLTARPLQLTVETLTEEYNGQPFTFSGYEITDGELVEGDTLQAVFETKNQSGNIINQLINVGNISSSGPKLTFVDKNGVDVSHLYAVETVAGTLTVKQRPLVIQTKNGELTYSGTEQNYLEYQLMDDFLLEGHTVKVITEKAATFLDRGEYENSMSFVIVDADGNDVSANYSINVGYGQVTVKPRKVTVTTLGTGENPFIYDGKDHELQEIILENATNADDYAVVEWTSVHAVGTYENVLTVAFFRNNSDNVSANYEIEYVYGELEVVPREISLKLTDVSREYDGTPLTSVRHEYVPGSLELVTGHTLTLETAGSVTLPDEGRVSNDYVPGTVKVTDGNGTEVTANYAITVESGTLSVEKRKLTLRPTNEKRVYDGKELTGDYETAAGTVVDGHTLDVTLSANATILVVGIFDGYSIENVAVKDADGADVTKYYDIDHSGTGRLEITPRPLYLQTPSASKVYDGTPLVASPEFIIVDKGPGTGLVEGDELFSENALNNTLPSITNVWEGTDWKGGSDGTIRNVQAAIVVNAQWTANYDISYEYGTLTIIRRKITLATDTLEKMYDGTPLSKVCEFAPLPGEGDGELASGQYLVNVSVAPAYTNVFDTYNGKANGTAGNNEQYAAVFTASGDDVSENYDITYNHGTLTVTKRPVLLRTESIERMYDGTPLNAEQGEWYRMTGSMFEDVLKDGEYFGLVVGHYVENNTWPMPSITNVNDGPIDNKLTAMIRDNMTWDDMTENYKISYDYGRLSLTKRPITLVSVGGEWVYDGKAHSFKDSPEFLSNVINGSQSPFYVVEGSIADGQVLSYMDYEIPTVTDVDEGEIENRIQAVIRAGIMSATQNYEITYESYGTLKVTPRHITVRLPNAAWTYDGTTHTVGTSADRNIAYDGVGLTAGFLATGHKLSVPGLSFIDAGEYSNEQVATVVDALGNPVKEGNYIIDGYEYGYITVERRPVTIRLKSRTMGQTYNKIYDGQTVTKFDWNVVSTLQLCTGHTMTVSALENDIIDAGTWDVNPDLDTLIIRDKAGKDVTRNYDPSGMVEEYIIDPRPITVLTDSASKLYDGTPLTAPGFKVVTDFGGMEIVPGHKVSLNVTAAPVTPGYYDNTADESSFCVYDAKGRDVTMNYCPAEDCEAGFVDLGTLAISVDVTIRVTTDSAEKIYDGTDLKCNSSRWEILSGELPDYFEVIVKVTGFQFDIGSSKNTAEVRVVDDLGRDVTDLVFDDPENDIEYVLGTLTVKDPKEELEELILTPIYRSKTYDGTPLDYSDLPWDQRLFITEQLQKLLDEGYTWDVEIRGSQIRAGSCDSYVIGESFVLYDPDGNIVTRNYILNTTEEGGKLVVYKHEPIKIYLYSLDVIYDGKIPEWTMDDYVIMYDGQELEWTDEDGEYVYYEFVTAKGEHLLVVIDWIRAPYADCGEWSVTQMNEYFNSCISYSVYVNGEWADFESMPIEFVMFEDEQTGYALSVTQASIEITADSATGVYDPDERPSLSSNRCHISKGALAEGHSVMFYEVSGEQNGIGKTENVIHYVIITDRDYNVVTHNYNISYVNGWLELT